ncbi:MAG TPA: hypothetical protein VLK84_23665 [Longimicrobium sp.]|nr:hypothetical protein [Longimicrobium sp.]
MHRLAFLLLIIAGLPARAAAQPADAPAALRGAPYSVPPGYTAAPASSDGTTAVYTQARTAVFVAAAPRDGERGAAIHRIRGLLARAVSQRAAEGFEWRMVASAPSSPFDVYHERWIGFDGTDVVIARFHHLRTEARGLLAGEAFVAGSPDAEQMFRNGIAPTWHTLSGEASSRLMADLVGDPPFRESSFHFEGIALPEEPPAQGAPRPSQSTVERIVLQTGPREKKPLRVAPEAPPHPDEAGVRAAFEGYRAALLARDGEAALAHVADAVVEYYGEVQRLALYATAAEVRARPLPDQLYVLLLRHRIPAERLRGMTPRELFAHSVVEGWIDEESAQKLHLDQVLVQGNLAHGFTTVNGRRSAVDLHFVRRGGAWKWDMLGVIQSMDPALRAVARTTGREPEALILQAAQVVTRRAAGPEIWNPPFPRAAAP